MSSFDPAPDCWQLPELLRFATSARGPLRALPGRHSWQERNRVLTSTSWSELRWPDLWDQEKAVCMAAGHSGVYFLDRRGTLMEVDDVAGARRLAPRRGELVGVSDDEARLVCDDVGERIVLWDGAERRTWAFSNKKWKRIGGPQPESGESLVCATPRGIYLLVGERLWLLEGEQWAPVGHADAGWRARLVWWSPKQDGLWMLTDTAIEIWTADGPKPVPGPALPFVRKASFNGSLDVFWKAIVTAGYDPVRNILFWYQEYFHYAKKGDKKGNYRAKKIEPPERTRILRLDELEAPQVGLPLAQRGKIVPPHVDDVPPADVRQHIYYAIEFSTHRQIDLGFFYVTTDRAEVRDVLDASKPVSDEDDDESEDSWRQERYHDLEDGMTVCVWTIQEGVLAHGLDVRPFLRILDSNDESDDDDDDERETQPRVAVDWKALAAKLPKLRSPAGATDDAVFSLTLVGDHPAPDIDTYLDFHIGQPALELGVNALVD